MSRVFERHERFREGREGKLMIEGRVDRTFRYKGCNNNDRIGHTSRVNSIKRNTFRVG